MGLRLLWSLAINIDNCRVMSNTEGLLSKIMAPLSSDLLHLFDHREWDDVVEASMKLASRLVAARGVTGVKLRRQISSNTQSVAAMEGILECNECQPALRELAIKILTQLTMDASSSFSAGRRDKLIKSLLGLFTDRNKDSSIRKPAGQALAMLSAKSEINAVLILQINGNVVGVLKEMLLNSEENESRISAAEILSRLLHSRYTRDDEYLPEELNKVIMDVMPEVNNPCHTVMNL